MKKTNIFIFIIIVIIAFFILNPFYIIPEGQQSVVIRLGKIVQTQVNAGLKIRIPFIDKVIRYSKKILSWDGESQRIPTFENQFIWVDTTARWKIVDPKKFYESVGTVTQALSRLDDVIDSGVRKIISSNSIYAIQIKVICIQISNCFIKILPYLTICPARGFCRKKYFTSVFWCKIFSESFFNFFFI